ncbi:MAG: DUF1543 domain-containing protein [Arachidicoccus sp.]|nr:DUF1543 domain-containing protein [Arachidicoccus sp.]
MENVYLHMLLLGCKPQGRHTEQHDILFTISNSLKDAIPHIEKFWPEAKDNIHIDAWRKVSIVDNFAVSIVEKKREPFIAPDKLFFINLGGYKRGKFEEYHYKILLVSKNKSDAIKKAKETLFFKENISAHIDDKYGVDVDDIYDVEDILPLDIKEKYSLQIIPQSGYDHIADELNIGYFKLSSFK